VPQQSHLDGNESEQWVAFSGQCGTAALCRDLCRRDRQILQG